MKTLRDLAPELRSNLLVLFLAGLLFWTSMASLLPTLPLYVQDVGGSKQDIGIVMGAFAIGLLFSRSWLGRLADQRSRKLVLLIGASCAAIAPLGYLAFHSIPLLMVIRAFHGISIAAFGTAFIALVTDIAPPNNRGEVIGYMSLVNPIGVALGPAMGGFMQEEAGYPLLFAVASMVALVSLACTLRVGEPTLSEALRSDRSAPQEEFWQLLNSPRIRVPTIMLLLVGIAFGTLSTFVPLFIQETGVDFNAGLFYTAAAIASFSIRVLIGRASDRYGRGLFISISLMCYSLAMMMLWYATSPTLFLLAGLIEGAGFGMLIPMVSAMMADRSLPQERGRVFGLCMAGFDLGLALAGPILGILAEQVGWQYRSLFACAAALAFASLFVFVTRGNKNMSHSLRFATGQGADLYAYKPVESR
ncbi:MFS transporter [Geitlerinema sp. PCC 7407]|uniref:MFS transporter n=1 Tax=Geitlerinema sp. PCC 7407 TaxID=1173025 RepID=UPI00029F9CD7|nr:major facilitator superfamily MFS_1 [Geitlerinema sp. PCC 7407]